MHEKWMKYALNLAKKAMEIGEVPVGAVIVKNDEIVGEGYNLRETDKNALAHAEIIAINQACEKLGGWRLSGCEIYVTLEPCPMCAGAIINARVEKVIFGAKDPKSGACGSVVNLFNEKFNHKPTLIDGVLEKECAEILKSFFRQIRSS